MERSQVILGGVVAVAIGAVVALAFSGESEPDGGQASPAPAPARAATGGGGAPKPEPTVGTPHAGPNQALARLKAAGEITPMKREGHRSKIDEARDGFADRAPMMSGKPPVREPEPSPSVLRPGMRWPLDRDGIRGAVREALPELTECYDAWVKLNPKIGGRVVVTFTIKGVDGEEGGKVVGAKLSDQSTLGHAPMEGCIVQVFEDLRFERPQDGSIDVTYPLEFSNGERDAGQ